MDCVKKHQAPVAKTGKLRALQRSVLCSTLGIDLFFFPPNPLASSGRGRREWVNRLLTFFFCVCALGTLITKQLGMAYLPAAGLSSRAEPGDALSASN